MPTRAECQVVASFGDGGMSLLAPSCNGHREMNKPSGASTLTGVASDDAWAQVPQSTTQDTATSSEPLQASNSAKKNKKDKKKKTKTKKGTYNGHHGQADSSASQVSKTRTAAEELKLFQNSNLLNQQDPMEQLYQQLNRLILDDPKSVSGQDRLQKGGEVQMGKSANQSSVPEQPTQALLREHADYSASSNMYTIKKGVLWQQQDYDKIRHRLFSRWKKRFFILTTDYLVCFKKSTSKVGRSEMGRFLYKTSLGDIEALEWTRPSKSDKGAIILRMRNQSSLFLWSKKDLDEWMLLIESMRRKRKSRLPLGANRDVPAPSQNGIYENTALPDGIISADSLIENQHIKVMHDGQMTQSKPARLRQECCSSELDSAHSKPMGQSLIERDNPNGAHRRPNNVMPHNGRDAIGAKTVMTRAAACMINDREAPARDESLRQEEQGSLHDTGIEDSSLARRSPQDKASSVASSRVSRQEPSEGSSLKHSNLNTTRHAVHKDSNDNLIQSGDSQSRSDQLDKTFVHAGVDLKTEGQDFESSELTGESSHGKPPFEAKNSEAVVVDMASRLNREAETPRRLIKDRTFVKQERPTSNLIRRDDSWHSSLSLNQIGNSHIQALEVARRSLYADNQIPHSNQASANFISGRAQQRLYNNSIDATATPLRGKAPVRQQSLQLYGQRRLPPIMQHQANSFDAANSVNSPSQVQKQPIPSLSYQQKLLQLQLLHNSNNIDYVRNNASQHLGNDYQIYGPGSIATTNHYGYYSMRSNLKSAASEFSFIRPSSSDFHPPGMAPLHPATNALQSGSGPDFSHRNNHQTTFVPVNQSNHVYNPEEFVAISSLENALAAPTRDLPLKPNKKRQQLNDNGSTSFGSSIVHFFKRAFSRRSKHRPKMAESCSSSLGGALNYKLESIQRARSAFSTTEGARLERNDTYDQQQSLIEQRHRMIDLIEAFSNKTAIDPDTFAKLSQQNQLEAVQHLSTLQRMSMRNDMGPRGEPIKYLAQNPVGSPLHKSNSISTSTGLSGLNEMMRINERQMIMASPRSPAINSTLAPMTSPLIGRSTKVMSTHSAQAARRDIPNFEGRYFESPERSMVNSERMPRPSSIYGQPSMISTPVFSGVQGRRGNEFGVHRSSIHSYHQKPEPSRVSSMESKRHHQTIKAPFLDTTREVAEEVSSPTVEDKSFIDFDMGNKFRTANNEPIAGARNNLSRQQQQRRAIVNPILQSPTMSLIYDNHPAANSHYDNHPPFEYVQSASSMDLTIHTNPHPANPQYDFNNRLINRLNNGVENHASISPLAKNSKSRQSFMTGGGSTTPLHYDVSMPYQQSNNTDGTFQMNLDRNEVSQSRPAALINPSTPTSRLSQEIIYRTHVEPNSLASIDQLNPYARAQSRPKSFVKPSPVRIPSQQTSIQYHQSPLVDRQARVITRSDGVQATMIKPEVARLDHRQHEAVMSIAGRPGANLEPSSEQSILRGTNIDVHGVSSACLQKSSTQAGPSTKTFIVASRPFKTSTETASNSKKDCATVSGSSEKSDRGQSKEEECGSRSTGSGTDTISTSSSSKSDMSVRRKGLDRSSARNVHVNELDMGGHPRQRQMTSRSSSDSRRRGSSTDHSEESSIQAEFLDVSSHEEKKWVTSKLMQ